MRAAFALGGLGSGFATNEKELDDLVAKAFGNSPQDTGFFGDDPFDYICDEGFTLDGGAGIGTEFDIQCRNPSATLSESEGEFAEPPACEDGDSTDGSLNAGQKSFVAVYQSDGQADGTLHIPVTQRCKPISCGEAPAVAHATVHGGTLFGALMDATRRTRQAGGRSDNGKPAVALNHAGGHDEALHFSGQHPRTWGLKPRSGSQDDQKESYNIGAFQFYDRHPRTGDLKPRSGSQGDQ